MGVRGILLALFDSRENVKFFIEIGTKWRNITVFLSRARNLIYLRLYLPMFWSQSSRSRLSKRLNLSSITFRLFPSPRSHDSKMQVLRHFGGSGAWIETGTYFGDGTLAISKFAKVLHTIEPSKKLSAISKNRVGAETNIHFHTGTSEDLLPEILETLVSTGYRDLSLWLDGHYSGGETFLGELETPIKKELETLAIYEKYFEKVQVFIDDIRCFNPKVQEFRTYPEIQYLLDYANRHKMKILFTKDICVLRKQSHEN